MSDFGEVFIYPTQFFEVVGGLRTGSAGDPDLPVLTVPDTAHDGGTSSLGALASAIEATRTAMTANLEIAARILTAAAANTIEADMVEEGYSDYTHLPNPGDLDGRVPTDDAGLYGDVFQYIEGPAAEED